MRQEEAPFILDKTSNFPDPRLALNEPNGLIAIGGDLKPERLLAAYKAGIFPWYEAEPILWWSPDPRAVILLEDFHFCKRLKRTLRDHPFTVKADENFEAIIQACAAPRIQQGERETGTWLTPAMQAAYLTLHQLGYAHSVEIYLGQQLIGGIYGIALGKLFFGESMFSRQTGGSKIALYYLVQQLKRWQFELIDCQVPSAHLLSLGASLLQRTVFLEKLALNNKLENQLSKWVLDKDLS